MKTNEEIYDVTLNSVNMLFNLRNLCQILDMAIPDDVIVGRKTKITKEGIINNIQYSINALRENNAEIQRWIKEKDRIEKEKDGLH